LCVQKVQKLTDRWRYSRFCDEKRRLYAILNDCRHVGFFVVSIFLNKILHLKNKNRLEIKQLIFVKFESVLKNNRILIIGFDFFSATEIRCQEKSKGGLSYEVILAEPAVTAQLPKLPVTPGKNMSAEDIEEKLKAAEDRRLVSYHPKKLQTKILT
jgi:Stathmin family